MSENAGGLHEPLENVQAKIVDRWNAAVARLEGG